MAASPPLPKQRRWLLQVSRPSRRVRHSRALQSPSPLPPNKGKRKTRKIQSVRPARGPPLTLYFLRRGLSLEVKVTPPNPRPRSPLPVPAHLMWVRWAVVGRIERRGQSIAKYGWKLRCIALQCIRGAPMTAKRATKRNQNKDRNKTTPDCSIPPPGPPTPPPLPGWARSPPRPPFHPLPPPLGNRDLYLGRLDLGRLHSPSLPPLPAWGG